MSRFAVAIIARTADVALNGIVVGKEAQAARLRFDGRLVGTLESAGADYAVRRRFLLFLVQIRAVIARRRRRGADAAVMTDRTNGAVLNANVAANRRERASRTRKFVSDFRTLQEQRSYKYRINNFATIYLGDSSDPCDKAHLATILRPNRNFPLDTLRSLPVCTDSLDSCMIPLCTDSNPAASFPEDNSDRRHTAPVDY